jgi:hypothetical protein
VLAEDLVRLFLRGQNLEQVRRVDEAIPLYEQAVTARFDAIGPYDRLIYIYEARAKYADVVRVASAALANVRTADPKREWYEQMRAAADEAVHAGVEPRGAEF